MGKIIAFGILFSVYAGYSILVYTKGTEAGIYATGLNGLKIDQGKSIYQEYNCTACHQLYGLGGFLGPELTTAWSDPAKGELYMRSILKHGGLRMPDFKLSEHQIDCVLSYLKYVDSTATTYKK